MHIFFCHEYSDLGVGGSDLLFRFVNLYELLDTPLDETQTTPVKLIGLCIWRSNGVSFPAMIFGQFHAFVCIKVQ